VGAALASAGVLSQGLFRNPLADPSVLGATSGGSAGAALMFYFGAAGLQWFSLPLAAFTGALLATGFILHLSSRRFAWTMESLLLAGFAINALFGALTSLVVSLVLEDYQTAPAIMYWLLGGLNARGWEHVAMVFVPLVVALSVAYVVAARLDVLALGEDVARTLSVNVRRLKRASIVVIALLVGVAVSVAGAIPFVGLVVPHLTRLICGPSHRRLVLVSAINGVTLVVLADLAARTLRAPAELQVGVLIALLGAPFFLWLLISRRQGGDA
jgi:iron complex transport system permease protein